MGLNSEIQIRKQEIELLALTKENYTWDYYIAWVNTKTGVAGCGEPTSPRATLDIWVEEMNEKYPYIKHVVVHCNLHKVAGLDNARDSEAGE